MNKDTIKSLLKEDITILLGKSNSGKTTLLNDMMLTLSKVLKLKNLYTYGIKNSKYKMFYSLLELEQIKNSFIFIDEIGLLFNLDDRKNKDQIDKILRLVNHNNNKLVLTGLPTDFKKFLSAKANTIIFKSLNKTDLINGSETKNVLVQYKDASNGVLSLQIPIDKALVYNKTDGFYMIDIEYSKATDTKQKNLNLWKVEK